MILFMTSDILSLPFWSLYLSFRLHVHPSMSGALLNSGGKRHLCLLSDLKTKAFHISPLSEVFTLCSLSLHFTEFYLFYF